MYNMLLPAFPYLSWLLMDHVDCYVLCDKVLEGLRDSEVTAVVSAESGRPEFIRASVNGLYTDADQKRYLRVALVGENQKSNTALIQFPEEADSGANRIWVPASRLLNINERVTA